MLRTIRGTSFPSALRLQTSIRVRNLPRSNAILRSSFMSTTRATTAIKSSQNIMHRFKWVPWLTSAAISLTAGSLLFVSNVDTTIHALESTGK